jgi:hypothetical protein
VFGIPFALRIGSFNDVKPIVKLPKRGLLLRIEDLILPYLKHEAGLHDNGFPGENARSVCARLPLRDHRRHGGTLRIKLKIRQIYHSSFCLTIENFAGQIKRIVIWIQTSEEIDQDLFYFRTWNVLRSGATTDRFARRDDRR